MGFCEPARQDYSPPPPTSVGGGEPSSSANGGGYAPPPPPPPLQTAGAKGPEDGDGFYDEGVDPEVERHEYDPEACKVWTSLKVCLKVLWATPSETIVNHRPVS